MAHTVKNILSLNCSDAKGFFMKSEQCHGFELPEYFTFDEEFKYVRETVRDSPYKNCFFVGAIPEGLSDVNLNIELNKEALSSVFTQIDRENNVCANYALRFIRLMIDSLKCVDEKCCNIKLIYHKLCNQLSSSYNQIWLQTELPPGQNVRHIPQHSSPLPVSSGKGS